MNHMSRYYENAPLIPWPFTARPVSRQTPPAPGKTRKPRLAQRVNDWLVLVAMKELKRATTTQQIADHMNKSKGVVLRRLSRLTKEQLVCRIGAHGCNHITWQLTQDGARRVRKGRPT